MKLFTTATAQRKDDTAHVFAGITIHSGSLAYKNQKLGTVYRNTNIEGEKMGVEFAPFGMKDFLEPAINSDGTKVTF